jgi:hypothetical protein
MLAPNKSMRQGKACAKSDEKNRVALAIEDALPKNSALESDRALARQNSHQRQSHERSRQERQQHPSAQLRVRLR